MMHDIIDYFSQMNLKSNGKREQRIKSPDNLNSHRAKSMSAGIFSGLMRDIKNTEFGRNSNDVLKDTCPI